jgi:enoyl-CoA hydratase
MLRIQRSDGVATIEMVRPPLNLLTMELRSALARAALELGADDTVRTVVLGSALPGVFSAGSDVREFPSDAGQGVVRSAAEQACFDAVAQMPQPVIARLSGHVLGGGLELALACDVRIADTSARLALPESGLGVFPTGGGTQRLGGMVGLSRAKLMMMLGEVLSADDARAAGVVDEVVEPAELDDRTQELAGRIAARPAQAVQAIKAAVDHGRAHGFDAGQAKEVELAVVFGSADAQEGVAAFLASRTPVFRHE